MIVWRTKRKIRDISSAINNKKKDRDRETLNLKVKVDDIKIKIMPMIIVFHGHENDMIIKILPFRIFMICFMQNYFDFVKFKILINNMT